MTFEGQYLTYSEYRDLGGSEIGQMPFNLLEFEARRNIDIRTFNRVKELDEIPQEVKLCEYNLINSINNYVMSNNAIGDTGNIASENIDGYSVNYITTEKISEVVKSKNDEIKEIIRTYLLGVVTNDEHLMFCGVGK